MNGPTGYYPGENYIEFFSIEGTMDYKIVCKDLNKIMKLMSTNMTHYTNGHLAISSEDIDKLIRYNFFTTSSSLPHEGVSPGGTIVSSPTQSSAIQPPL